MFFMYNVLHISLLDNYIEVFSLDLDPDDCIFQMFRVLPKVNIGPLDPLLSCLLQGMRHCGRMSQQRYISNCVCKVKFGLFYSVIKLIKVVIKCFSMLDVFFLQLFRQSTLVKVIMSIALHSVLIKYISHYVVCLSVDLSGGK